MRSTLTLFFSRQAALLGAALLLLPLVAVAQTPAWQWGAASQLVVPPDAQTGDVSMAVDAAGRGYLAGTFRNNVFNATSPPAQINFGPTRLVGNPAAIRNGFVAQATPAGQWAWAVAVRASGASGFTPEARVFDVATAPNGDVYVCGYAQGTQVQVGTLSAALSAALGPNGFNLYVARLTAAGLPLWVQTVAGGLPSANNVRLAVNPLTGGAVVAHVFAGRLQFGTLPALVTPNSNKALFVAELNPAGQWVSAVQSNAAGVGGVDALAAGPQGQLALTLDYEGGPLVLGSLSLPAPAPLATAFAVADLGPAGLAPGRQWRWAVSTGEAPVVGVAYRPDGGVWVSGYGRGGNAVGGTTLPGTDVVGYLGRLTAAGQWASVTTAVGNPGTTVALGPMATDGAGNAVVAGFATYNGPVGSSTTTLTLGPNTLTATNGSPIFFAARLSPAGTWAYAVAHPMPAGPPGAGLIYRLFDAALDPAGNLLTGGDFTGSLTVGPTVNSSTGSNNREAVLSRLGAAGVLSRRPAALAPTLSVFPNPARSTATLHLPAPAETAAAAVLLDALGREVRRYAVPARATEALLDLGGLAPGLYLVRCGAAVGRLVVE